MSIAATLSPTVPLRFLDANVRVERRRDATMVLRTEAPFESSDALVHDYLKHWAHVRPQTAFLAERNASGDGWRTVSYAEAYEKVEILAASFARRELGPDRPILILSGNGIDHQFVALAAMTAGIPYTPLSVAYSTMSGDLGKLRAIIKILDPGLVFAAQGEPFSRALAIDEIRGREVVIGDDYHIPGAISLAALLEPTAGCRRRRAIELPVETVAKILFTSGSTGTPKGVPTTHRMMCTSLSQVGAMWPFMLHHTPIILDWLPWSHVFGGSYSVNTVLRYGGTLYIDDGRPIPGEIDRTVRNLREIRPSLYWNVPKGYELLLPRLRLDEIARRNFYGDLTLMFYAGASLPAALWKELVELGRETAGRDIPMTTSWGLTETAPSITMVNRSALAPGNIGIPMPGLELKLVPHEGKLEARVRGPNVMRGYWKMKESQNAFDEEGFFCTGDAVAFVDPEDPAQGLIFDGRTTEDFKLSTGTWVNAAAIRLRAQSALSGLIADVVVTGADRNDIGLLILPAAGHSAGDSAYKERLRASLGSINDGATGTSQRIVRAIVLRQPPTFDSGEITEKGSLNSRLIRERRSDIIETLYLDAHPEIIKVS
jgi:feruloyl-CoA synthase